MAISTRATFAKGRKFSFSAIGEAQNAKRAEVGVCNPPPCPYAESGRPAAPFYGAASDSPRPLARPFDRRARFSGAADRSLRRRRLAVVTALPTGAGSA